MPYCTACGGEIHERASYCRACGANIASQAAAQPQHASGATAAPVVWPPQQAPPNVGGSFGAPTGPGGVTQGAAVAALLLNIIVWPGLGSLVAGAKVGWWQGFLFLLGIPLVLILIGIPIMIGAWIWGVVTGVRLLNGVPPDKA